MVLEWRHGAAVRPLHAGHLHVLVLNRGVRGDQPGGQGDDVVVGTLGEGRMLLRKQLLDLPRAPSPIARTG
jgi:hypothetical protein